MVNIPKRMRKLQTALLAIRMGSGAVVLPKEVQSIEMRFAAKINGGHMGPRKFWREEMRRLQYHNPTVSMRVQQTESSSDPAVMSIHFAASAAEPESNSGASIPSHIEQINMKNFTNSEIMDALVKLTKAYPIEPTPGDLELAENLKEQRIRSEREIKVSEQVRARARREKQLLEQARGAL